MPGKRAPCLMFLISSLIDHTLLRPDATAGEIDRLCGEALEWCFAAVCVNPYWVRRAADRLKESSVKVATVVGFPLGANASSVKAFEAERAIADGASEIDMVLNIGELRAGNVDAVRRDIEAVVQAAHAGGTIVKVILETSLLTVEQKVAGCRAAKDAGADFVKTSTGFGGGGATASDIALMRATVGPAPGPSHGAISGSGMGVKASGGVRTLADARAMVAAGANRIGTSAGVAIAQAEREEMNREARSKTRR